MQKNVVWQEIWGASEWTRPSFNEAMKKCKETVKVLPVVCLDDVETMLKRPQEFGEGFYDNLRAAMGNSQVMLVVASFEPLHTYKVRYQLTSLFFNQGLTVELKQFEPTEVETLLLWAGKANFNKQQKQRMRQWGEQHPYLLQLAGVWLWEAQTAGKDERFAKQGFEEDKRRNLSSTPLPSSTGFPNPLKWLGQFAKQVGHWWHESHETVYGLVIVIAVILAILYGLGMTVMKLGWHPFEFVTHIWNALFGTHPEGH